jgi:ATP-binding cassette subfamily B protein
MTSTTLSSEFTLTNRKLTNRKGPIRWILSHASYYWYFALVMVLGAIGNAGLASVVPIYLGKAFNLLIEGLADNQALLRIAFIITISQVVRSLLQFGRNFSAELIGQNLEREIRDELYVSLLGKSMTFHSLQPVGDTMARATNDVREINFMFNPGVNLVIGSVIFLIMPIVLAPNYHPSLIIAPLAFMVL